jgi:hypothetical protein
MIDFNLKVGDNYMAFALFLVFLVLKLTSVISWSWWWITAPLWGTAALGLLVLACVAVVMVLKKLLQ